MDTGDYRWGAIYSGCKTFAIKVGREHFLREKTNLAVGRHPEGRHFPLSKLPNAGATFPSVVPLLTTVP